VSPIPLHSLIDRTSASAFVKRKEKQNYRYGGEKMKRLPSVALCIVFLPLLAMAQSDFDGTSSNCTPKRD
jgi:hypothetical protein